MADYEKIAKRAKIIQDVSKLVHRIDNEIQEQPGVFFEKVSDYIEVEMNKANVELLKRGMGEIARNRLPGFPGVIFLAIGTASLCRVEVATKKGVSKIIASISGPPNRFVTSRKVYVLNQQATASETGHAQSLGLPSNSPSPEEIAEDIIEGIIVGKFESAADEGIDESQHGPHIQNGND